MNFMKSFQHKIHGRSDMVVFYIDQGLKVRVYITFISHNEIRV